MSDFRQFLVCFLILTSVQSLMSFQLRETIPGEISDIYGVFLKQESLSLSAPSRNTSNLCTKEIPVIFFQTEINQHLRGNGSLPWFHRMDVCCNGYKPYKYDRRKCVPDCGDKCRNGFCVAPNECECFDGFVKNETGACLFTCPVECPNGRCYINGTCACNEGYTLDPTGRFCKAVCNPSCGFNQVCVSPDVCTCREGYKMSSFGCQPMCVTDCGHGKCVAPNRCECFPGFEWKNGVCQAPSCNLRCENGFCETRIHCVCHDGYRYDKNTTSCLPDCADDCKYGVCIAPGVCRCFKGYEQKDKTCVPICYNGCGYYGKCIEPNVCGCGAVNQKCERGNCDSRGKCHCEEGLTRFVDKCVHPSALNNIIGSYEKKMYFNREIQNEFDKLIGRHFHI